MHDPVQVAGFSRQILHYSLIVAVLPNERTRKRVADDPQGRGEVTAIGSAQFSSLIKETFDALSAHGGHQAPNERRVDRRLLLRLLVAQHGHHLIKRPFMGHFPFKTLPTTVATCCLGQSLRQFLERVGLLQQFEVGAILLGKNAAVPAGENNG